MAGGLALHYLPVYGIDSETVIAHRLARHAASVEYMDSTRFEEMWTEALDMAAAISQLREITVSAYSPTLTAINSNNADTFLFPFSPAQPSALLRRFLALSGPLLS